MEELRKNIFQRFRNTELGLQRIKKNLGLEGFSEIEIVQYCEKIIEQTPIECFKKIGKNYYITSKKNNSILTINSFTMTVITANESIK